MPILTLATLPSFFEKEFLKKEGEEANDYQNNKPYARNPNSTWVYKMVHSGGLNSANFSFSCYIFLNEQPSIVVFKTGYRWLKKYAFIASPGKAYLTDISSVGMNLYPTCLLKELNIFISNNQEVPDDVRIAVDFMNKVESTKGSLDVTSLARKQLGSYLKQLDRSIKSNTGKKLNEVFPLNEMKAWKRHVNRGAGLAKDPIAFMDGIQKNIMKDLKAKMTTESFKKSFRTVAIKFVPGAGQAATAAKATRRTVTKVKKIKKVGK